MRLYWDELISKWYYWYSPGDITFKPEHCLFLLEHKELLREGQYPREPAGDYFEIAYIRIISPSWNHASNIWGELSLRLQRVSRDAREALLDETIQLDKYNYLSRPAARALHYISGWERKKTSFRQWRYKNE